MNGNSLDKSKDFIFSNYSNNIMEVNKFSKLNNEDNNKNQDSSKEDFINFYGRTTGYLSKRAKYLLENILPNYILDIKSIKNGEFYNLTSQYEAVNLEIGFGSGDFIFNSSVANPKALYLGVEVFLNGIASLLDKIDNYTSTTSKYVSNEKIKELKKLQNITIYNFNIYYLLKYFRENTFDNIYILFPDPWPKKKHHKRRIINESNLALFSKILKKNGTIRFISDHNDYVAWGLEHFIVSSNFQIQMNSPQDFTEAPKDHFKTKYEKKAESIGENVTYINCKNFK